MQIYKCGFIGISVETDLGRSHGPQLQGLGKAGSPSSLNSLLSTDKALRSHVHVLVSSISIRSDEDILLLTSQEWTCLKHLCVTQQLPDTGMAQLASHPWPGIVSLNFEEARLVVPGLQKEFGPNWSI